MSGNNAYIPFDPAHRAGTDASTRIFGEVKLDRNYPVIVSLITIKIAMQ